MDGEMHILYTFTPVQDLSVSINWQVFRSEMEALDKSGLRVMTFLGLKPAVVNRMYVKSFLTGVEILTYILGRRVEISKNQPLQSKRQPVFTEDSISLYS